MTQGLLTIIRDGKVVVKIVTGCDGSVIPTLAESLRAKPTTDPYELLKRCRDHDLGGDTLIVQSSPDEWLCDGVIEELPALYKEKFHDPRFNPRWGFGTAEYMELIELTK